MKKLVVVFIAFFLLSGCITIDTGINDLNNADEATEPDPVKLTTERVEYDEDGTAYIMVAFPGASIEHKFVEDNGEIIAVAKLPKSQ